MPQNWKPTTWGELATLEYGKGLLGYENANGDFPVYGTNGKIGFHTEPLFDKAGVIIGRKGAYRGVHYSKTPFFVIDTAFYLKPKTEIDLRWAYYQLLTQDINSMDSGSAIPSTSRPDFYALPLLLPPLSEQHAIAEILGALDDKIELNRRMNRTLESMARAVFCEMMKDESGRMKVEKLADICEFAYGKGLKEDKRQAGSIPVYGSNGQIGWHNEYLVKGPGIVVGRKGNPGIVTWAQNDFFPIDTTFYVVPKEAKTSLYWLYYTLISLNLPDLGADSAVPGLNRNIAYMSDVDYPPHDLMNKFDAFVMPLFGKIDANEKQSRTLASLRDTLLPKLMRGEVRVSLTDSKTD